ncbi:MAG TPA: hypothetical protein VFD39_03025 [Trueperaceae bacterium]|nr:hypothetical protein [Trueperaceae bacterium]
MSKRRGKQAGSSSGGTLSLEEAAALLDVPVDVLLEAVEESGIRPATAGKELRLETAEIEKYRRLVEQSQVRAREQLLAFREEME